MNRLRASFPLANAAFVCVCVSGVLTSNSWAQQDEKYAHPDGEDSYGPTYDAKELPSEINAQLDAQGRYVVPDFFNLTIKRDELECWVVNQDPPRRHGGHVRSTGCGAIAAHLWEQ
jgi:hypothetical protein